MLALRQGGFPDPYGSDKLGVGVRQALTPFMKLRLSEFRNGILRYINTNSDR